MSAPAAMETRPAAAARRPAVPAITTTALPMTARALITLIIASLIGLAAFFWPFLAAPDSAAVAHARKLREQGALPCAHAVSLSAPYSPPFSSRC